MKISIPYQIKLKIKKPILVSNGLVQCIKIKLLFYFSENMIVASEQDTSA